MQLTINGETQTVEATTISELIHEMGLTGQAVAVELNRQVIPKRQHDKTVLSEGDTLEVVTLVGGG